MESQPQDDTPTGPAAGARAWARDEGFDARTGGKLRAVIVLLPALLFAFGWCFLIALCALVAPRAVRRNAAFFARTWGKVLLALFGIRIEQHQRAMMEATTPSIILFNHQSLLDLCVLAAVWPDRAAVLYKQEFHKVPFIGRALRVMGMIPVDRQDRAKAVKSLRAAAQRVLDERMQVFISPEGTRSKTSGLLEFKRGPFHMALQTKAPLVLLVMRGVRSVMPHDARLPRTGRIRVDWLGPVETRDWTSTVMDERVQSVRAMFLDLVPPSPGTEPDAG